MNTALLLMTSALMAGADAPAAPAAVAPVAVSASCGCAPSCDPCAKPSLLDRIKAHFAKHRKPKCGCDCAPACAPAPVPACAPAPVACCTPAPAACAPACDPCAKSRKPLISLPLFCGNSSSTCDTCDPCAKKPGFFEKIKARLASSGRGNCDSCTSCSSGCSTGPAMTAPAAPAETPKEMPKPKDTTKPKTTAELPLIPLASPTTDVPSIPVLGGTSSKY